MGRVCVTAATGYIGSRLVPKLLEHGFIVRCLVRDPNKLAPASWAEPRSESSSRAIPAA